MKRKPFDELTIADDFMFCKVMENKTLCKTFLEMLLTGTISKITYLASQNAVITNSKAKAIRLDVLVKDETGKSYDLEMQVSNEYNIPKRMRYYQGALDVAFLDQGYSYQSLNDSFIVFICLFDPLGYGRAVYTFETSCVEDKQIRLQDGTKKIIVNAQAFQQTTHQGLRGFLRYIKTGEVTTEYTRRIAAMIQKIKNSERARKEYRILPAFIMDAREEGMQQGIQQGKLLGLAEGEAKGKLEGKLETAKNLLTMGLSIENIIKATGLTTQEVKQLTNG